MRPTLLADPLHHRATLATPHAMRAVSNPADEATNLTARQRQQLIALQDALSVARLEAADLQQALRRRHLYLVMAGLALVAATLF